MDLKRAIDALSAQYRKELQRLYDLRREFVELNSELKDAEDRHWETITAARRDYLHTRMRQIKYEIDLLNEYSGGIHDARETLLNLCKSEGDKDYIIQSIEYQEERLEEYRKRLRVIEGLEALEGNKED